MRRRNGGGKKRKPSPQDFKRKAVTRMSVSQDYELDFAEFFDCAFDAFAEVYPESESIWLRHLSPNTNTSGSPLPPDGKMLSFGEAREFFKNCTSFTADALCGLSAEKLLKICSDGRRKQSFCFTNEKARGIIRRYILSLYAVKGQNKLYATICESEESGGELTLSLNKNAVTYLHSEILYIDYGNHSVDVHTDKGKTSFFSVTFADAADSVLKNRCFLRSYKNCVVNMDRIKDVDGDSFVMDNGDVISIPKRRLRDIKSEYGTYLALRREV